MGCLHFAKHERGFLKMEEYGEKSDEDGEKRMPLSFDKSRQHKQLKYKKMEGKK